MTGSYPAPTGSFVPFTILGGCSTGKLKKPEVSAPDPGALQGELGI